MKKVYLVPNIITAFGLACGLFVILKVAITDSSASTFYDVLFTSTILLVVAALADILDGAIARFVRAESEFGALFDSLADSINFGVAPAILMLKSLLLPTGSKMLFIALPAAMIFAICGVLRLVRFNVKAHLAKHDPQLALAHKKNFTGLPIPAAAAASVSTTLLLVSEEFKTLFAWSDEARAWILAAVMIILGYFMISRWKFPSIKTLHFRLDSFSLVLLTAIGGVFVLYGLVYHFVWVLFVGSWLFLLAGWVLSIIRLIAGKKSTTLQDFEPDHDEFEE